MDSQKKTENHLHLEQVAPRLRTVSVNSSIPDNFGSVAVVTTNNPDDSEIKEEEDDVITAPDGGWGWVVLGAAFLAFATQGFVFTGSAVLYVSLVEYFEADHGVTGWILSLYSFTGNILGVVFGAVIKRYGARMTSIIGSLIGTMGITLCYFLVSIPYMCFTYGCVAGVGSTLTIMPASVSLQVYFNKRRTFATGIGTGGLSLGGLVAPPILNALLNRYGLRGTYLMIAGIWLNNAVFASLFRPIASKNGKKLELDPWKAVLKDMFDFSVLKNIQLVLFLVGTLLFNFGTMGFIGHYFSRMTHLGIPRDMALIFQVFMVVCVGIGRIIFSIVGNLRSVDRGLLYSISITISGFIVFSFPIAKTTIPVAIYGMSQGLTSGCYFAVQLAFLVDITGVKQIPKVMGVLHMTFALVTLTAVPLTGFIFDVSQSYELPYFVIGAIHLVGGAVLLFLAGMRRTKWREKIEKTTDDI